MVKEVVPQIVVRRLKVRHRRLAAVLEGLRQFGFRGPATGGTPALCGCGPASSRGSSDSRSPHRCHPLAHPIPRLPAWFPTSWRHCLRHLLPPSRLESGSSINPPFRSCHRRNRTRLAADRAASLSPACWPVANNSHRADPTLTTMQPTGRPNPNDTTPKAVSLGNARYDDPARTILADPIPSVRAARRLGSGIHAYGHICQVSWLNSVLADLRPILRSSATTHFSPVINDKCF
jgi:hypothetical protein